MTVNTIASTAVALTNGATTIFPYNFPIQTVEDFVLEELDLLTGEITLISSDLYTVAGAGDPLGGDLEYPLIGDAIATGKKLLMSRSTEVTQLIVVSNQTSYNAEVVSKVWDKLTLIAQEHSDKLSRSLLVNVGEDVGRLSRGTDGTVLQWDTDGNIVEGPDGSAIIGANNSAISARAWAESDTAPDPTDLTSKSAKTLAREAKASYEGAAAIAASMVAKLLSYPEVIAHRGFAEMAPENTVIAMSNALMMGADSLELDISISADGTPWCFHDTTVDSATDGTGTFTSLTDAYIETLIMDGRKTVANIDVGISRFSNFLKFFRGTTVKCYPEFKALVNNTVDIPNIMADIQAAGVSKRMVMGSFYREHLIRCRDNDVECGLYKLINAGNLNDVNEGVDATITLLGTLGKGEIWLDKDLLLSSPELVAEIEGAGIGVGAWTVTSDDQANALREIGVTRFFSDQPLAGYKV